jgi:hypothetical protein
MTVIAGAYFEVVESGTLNVEGKGAIPELGNRPVEDKSPLSVVGCYLCARCGRVTSDEYLSAAYVQTHGRRASG